MQALSSGWHTAVVLGGTQDEPDVGMRQSMEGQELLTDVHGAHVQEADPWGTVIGFMTVVSSHERKAVGVIVVVVVQWLSEWDVVRSVGSGVGRPGI